MIPIVRRVLVLAILVSVAHADPRTPKPVDKGSPATKEADRHFKSGVALFKEGKYTEALAEFERAYDIAPHPLVLYNIAGCHRELSHYGDAVKFYERFLEEGPGQVPDSRLTAARTELDSILARIARVTVTASPVDATIFVDDEPLGALAKMPLILPPGEHVLVAKAPGRKDASRTIRVASGDALTVELMLPEAPVVDTVRGTPPYTRRFPIKTERFAVGAGFGTNLRALTDTGAPSLGVGVRVTSRLELGADVFLVAYAAMPSVRVRLAGDALSVHAIGAIPIVFPEGDMTGTFVAGAIGVGVRYRPLPAVTLRLEAVASFAGKAHGTTLPTILGGELWF